MKILFKKYHIELIKLRNECTELCIKYFIDIGYDIFKYQEDTREFELLKSTYVSVISTMDRYLKVALRALSKKRIQNCIDVLNYEYNRWERMLQLVEDHHGCIENLDTDLVSGFHHYMKG